MCVYCLLRIVCCVCVCFWSVFSVCAFCRMFILWVYVNCGFVFVGVSDSFFVLVVCVCGVFEWFVCSVCFVVCVMNVCVCLIFGVCGVGVVVLCLYCVCVCGVFLLFFIMCLCLVFYVFVSCVGVCGLCVV